MGRAIDLRGRSILISGASSGIGAATAIACADKGMKVGLLARSGDKLGVVAERIRGRGGTAHAVVGDVTSDEDCARAIEECEGEIGDLYAVIANAGYGKEDACHSMRDEDVRAMFETNFHGSLRLVQPMIERFRERGAGHAIFVSSCLSKVGMPYYGCYCATKAAQDYFARAMRLELGGSGVHVSSVHPVGTDTSFFDTAAELSGGELKVAGSKTKGVFQQDATRVSGAIVKCLEKPRGEVWTSTAARLGLAGMVAFPGLTDRMLARKLRKRLGARGDEAMGNGR